MLFVAMSPYSPDGVVPISAWRNTRGQQALRIHVRCNLSTKYTICRRHVSPVVLQTAMLVLSLDGIMYWIDLASMKPASHFEDLQQKLLVQCRANCESFSSFCTAGGSNLHLALQTIIEKRVACSESNRLADTYTALQSKAPRISQKGEYCLVTSFTTWQTCKCHLRGPERA